MSLTGNEGRGLEWLRRIVIVLATLALLITLYTGAVGGLGALTSPKVEPSDEIGEIEWEDNKQAFLFPDKVQPDNKDEDELSEAEERKSKKDKLVKGIVNRLVDFTTKYPKQGEPRLTSFDTWTKYLRNKQIRVIEVKNSDRVLEYLEGLDEWVEEVLKDDEFIAAYRLLKTEQAVEDISRAVYTYTNKFAESVVDIEKEATLSKADADKKNALGMEKLGIATVTGTIFFMALLILLLIKIEKHLRVIASVNVRGSDSE